MAPKINQKDPLFIGTSNATGAMLIPIKLIDPENYGIWSRSMKIALLRKWKYDFFYKDVNMRSTQKWLAWAMGEMQYNCLIMVDSHNE